MIGYVVVLGIAGLIALNQPLPERVTLLPDRDGGVGEVIVTPNAQQPALRLHQAFTVAQQDAHQQPKLVETNQADVQRRYGKLLDALPPRPVTYVLYFELGSDRLTPASLSQLTALKKVLLDWPAPELRLVGHTDRVGKLEDNDLLSMARARKLRDILLGEGLDPMSLEVTGRGEREPLIPTPDEVAEPRNRRVEIVVR